MKKFLLGVLVTLTVEAIVFIWNTCGMQVQTKYYYNPQAVTELLGNATSFTKIK